MSDDRDGRTKQSDKNLSVPVPTPEEWDATLARIAKGQTRHGSSKTENPSDEPNTG
jgi:hypothetical protein